jgi:hypothetical protein
MSYVDLTNNILNFTQNNDAAFVAMIPTFIQMAERQIYMEAKLPATRKTTTGATVIGSRSITLPTDYVVGKAIEITSPSGVVNLLPKSVEFITEMYPVIATVAQPKFYAQDGVSALTVGPTPDAIYTVTFHYFAVPSSIVTASTTWLDTNFPHVLLYASLVHAYIFMKGDEDVMKFYKAAFDTGMKEMQDLMAATKQNDFR